MKLLIPLKIDNRHDANLEVRVAGGVDLVRNNRAVQTFIEEDIAAFG